MIMFFKMAQFVQYHVVDQPLRNLNQLQMKTKTSRRAATTPARFHLADREFGIGNSCSGEAIRILQQHPSPDDFSAALLERIHTAGFLNQIDIVASLSQTGLNLARSVGDSYWEGELLLWSAYASRLRGDVTAALQPIQEALAIFEALGNRWGYSMAYSGLAELRIGQKEYQEAKQRLEYELSIAKMFGHIFSTAIRNF